MGHVGVCWHNDGSRVDNTDHQGGGGRWGWVVCWVVTVAMDESDPTKHSPQHWPESQPLTCRLLRQDLTDGAIRLPQPPPPLTIPAP